MTQEGQDATKAAYEDPDIVAGYIQTHSENPKLFATLDQFQEIIDGSRVIDIGCGPGHDAYRFAEHGFKVVGIDYSSEMIRRARMHKDTDNKPDFQQIDMRKLGNVFEENSFDSAWASASLLHIPKKDIPQVLEGIRKIVKEGGNVYIGLKAGGGGAKMVDEKKYGKPMRREFTFWQKDSFVKIAEKHGLILKTFLENTGGTTGTDQTRWLNFFFTVEK